MTNDFSDIESDFKELRKFILNDLDILLRSPVGGNYAAALIITTACEVLGPLRYENNGEREFFKEYLTPEEWKPVAQYIYNAIRNGLAHSFATKTIIQVNNSAIEIGISWRDKPHFKFDSVNSTVYINIRELSESLRVAFDKYQEELIGNCNLCAQYSKKRIKKRTVGVENLDERREWLKLMDSSNVPTHNNTFK